MQGSGSRGADLIDRSATLSSEELAEAASSTSLRIDVLSRAGGPSTVRHLCLPGRWALDVTELNGHVRAWGGLDGDRIAILAVQRPSAATICRTPMDASTILIMPPGTEIDAGIIPGLRYSTVLVPVQAWLEIEETVGIAGRPLASPGAFKLDPYRSAEIAASLATLPDSIRRVGGRGQNLPAAMEDYLGSLAMARMEAASDEYRPRRSLQRGIRQAWRAADYIAEHLGDDISVTALSRHAGASRRQLEYAFRSVFGVGPGQFLRTARLNESRRQLLKARDEGRSVTDIALALGITHLSRYAQSYRELFGESPRDTLLHARPR